MSQADQSPRPERIKSTSSTGVDKETWSQLTAPTMPHQSLPKPELSEIEMNKSSVFTYKFWLIENVMDNNLNQII